MREFSTFPFAPVAGPLALVAVAMASVILVAAPTRAAPTNAGASKDHANRVAVLFGIDDYGSELLNLNSPAHDVKLLGDTLREHTDFEVFTHRNVSRSQMIRALLDARDRANGGTIVFYYSGHAIQVDGENYLLPKGVQVKSMRDIPVEAVSVRQVLQVFHDVDMKVVILDSCRTNPFGLGGKSVGAPGLSRENLTGFRGALISYAAAPGTVAYDGAPGEPSPFTSVLTKNLVQPGLDLVNLFIETRGDLEKLTADRERGPQRSEEINSLTREHELVFVRVDDNAPSSHPPLHPKSTTTDGSSTTTNDNNTQRKKEERKVASIATAEAPRRRHVMIPGLQANALQDALLDAQAIDALNNVILSEFQNDASLVVVGSSDISALLEQESQNQLLGCDDDSCLAEIGEALGADLLVKTSLGAVGDSYVLSISLIDVTTATPLRRVTARAGRDENFLIEAAQKAVRQVLDKDADNGVIVIGTGVSNIIDDDDAFEIGPPPAWPFAALGGLSLASSLALATTSGVFYFLGFQSLGVSVVNPDYTSRVTLAKEQISTGNIILGVSGGALVATTLFAGAAAALFIFSPPEEGDDVTAVARAADASRSLRREERGESHATPRAPSYAGATQVGANETGLGDGIRPSTH